MEKRIIIGECAKIEREDLENICGDFDGKQLVDLKLHLLNTIGEEGISILSVEDFCELSNDELFDADDCWISSVNVEVGDIIYSDDEREAIIEELVDNDITDIRQAIGFEDVSFLADVLRGNGWTGYMQLNDTQLQTEYNEMLGMREEAE